MRALLLSAVVAALAGVANAAPLFIDASASLPSKEGRGHSMNAKAADVDGDGDLDLIVAMEFEPNRFLRNDGKGVFADASAALPRAARDSEEVALADFDGDGDLDVAVANEDDLRPELYLGDGKGGFVDASARLPIHVKANAVVALDADGDRRVDLFFGGDKVSALMRNRGRGRFEDVSFAALPDRYGANQDVAVGDVDGDGDLDLVLANEDSNQLYLNDGKGRFTLAPREAIARAKTPEESRDAELFDADGDGDLDLFFANVRLWSQQAIPQSRLLLNDGRGAFVDVTATWLPAREEQTLSAAPIDLDGDKRMDLVLTTLAINSGALGPGPVRVLRNTGAAFVDMSAEWLPVGQLAAGFDATPGDFNGDGRTDLFVSGRGGPDRLLLGIAP